MAAQGIKHPQVQQPPGKKLSGGRKSTDPGTVAPYLFLAPYLALFVVFALMAPTSSGRERP
jgi:hypothetical protein